MKKRNILFILIILFAFFLRFPFINKGMPFFYHEDEMHHFSRTVQMVQEGRFDPEYFLKPSLHFYLRIPVTALAFIVSVKNGHIKNLSEIKTTDTLGIGQYSQSMSHKGIVRANRLFSLFFSLLTTILIFFIAKELTENYLISFLSMLLFTFSAPEISLSTRINVDIPVMFFCTLSSFLALKTFKNFNISNLVLLCFAVGFSISTKYNAAPIYILPVLVVLLTKSYSIKNFVIALLLPILAFFIASPYAFFHYNVFLNHLAYEVWHYGVAGHTGHSATPGISQFLFYSNWFCKEAIGVIPFICMILGILYLIFKKGKTGFLVLSFPILFIFLMIFQKTNFTRNMLMALPCICIFSGIGLWLIFKNFSSRFVKAFLIILFLFQACYQTILLERKTLTEPKDSRLFVSDWIKDHSSINSNIFYSGELGFERTVNNFKNVAKVSQTLSQDRLYNMGANFLVFPTHIENKFPFLFTQEKQFDGIFQDKTNRLYVNPSITIYKANSPFSLTSDELGLVSKRDSKFTVQENGTDFVLTCKDKDQKDCWIDSRISKIALPNNLLGSKLKISYISPWANQKVKLFFNDSFIDISCSNLVPWSLCEKQILLPTDTTNEKQFYLIINKLISPFQAGFSKDKRFLGIMLK